MEKTFEFKAIPSGDCECFLFAVDEETYTRIVGRPPKSYDRHDHIPGEPDLPPGEGKLYRLYPNDLVWAFAKTELKITMTIEGESK